MFKIRNNCNLAISPIGIDQKNCCFKFAKQIPWENFTLADTARLLLQDLHTSSFFATNIPVLQNLKWRSNAI